MANSKFITYWLIVAQNSSSGLLKKKKEKKKRVLFQCLKYSTSILKSLVSCILCTLQMENNKLHNILDKIKC